MQRRWLSKTTVVASFALLACVLPERGGPSVEGAGGDSSGLDTGGDGPTSGGGVSSTGHDSGGGSPGTGGSSIGATGGSSEVAVSTGGAATTGGSIPTGGTSATGGAASASSSVTPDASVATFCAGLCEFSTNDGYIKLLKGSIFAYRDPQIIPDLTMVALGAVTNMDPGLTLGNRAHFRLGLYDDLNGMPNHLLAATALLTAQDVSSPVEGSITPPVTSGSNPSRYWIIMAIDATSDAYLEAQGVGQPEENFFDNGINCLPLATPDCPMPTLYSYYVKPFGVTTSSFVPLLYARYSPNG